MNEHQDHERELPQDGAAQASAKPHEPPPEARRYPIRIDQEQKVVDEPVLSGRQILALVDKTPEAWRLYLHRHGGETPQPVGPDEEIDLTTPGVERFTTMPREACDGEVGRELVREFRLPEADETYLAGSGYNWESVVDGNTRWLILRGWRVPHGYDRECTDLAMLIPTTYPDAQLDMMWFNPPLARVDGQPVKALAPQAIRGESYQRWSRHRGGTHPWRPGIDDVSTHLTFVDYCLRREFEGG